MPRLKYQMCMDCGCTEGEFHEYGCEFEECPFCGSPIVHCGCDLDHLGLRDRKLYTEATYYVKPDVFNNDFQLSPAQHKKWMVILNKKGRVPYIEYPLLCGRCGKRINEFFMVPDEEWEHYIPLQERRKVLCRECYRYIKWAIDKNTKPESERETITRQVISPSHVLWKGFITELRKQCNCQLKGEELLGWQCAGDFMQSKKILNLMPNVSIQLTLDYFMHYGVSCDCEVLFRIDRFDNYVYRSHTHSELEKIPQ